ncbi:prepilin peptidase [Candidatus Curtissbacteria bacterium]|nr:prepilin peptidase [Candidatus Curtissbacteria bacterium]
MFFVLLLAFILGGAIGSFLNVVIDRSTRGESILGRSYCDHCKATLSTIDLIPIISFVSFGARCRYCKKPISWQYPIVEGITGALFVLAFMVVSGNGQSSLISLTYVFFIISIAIVVAVVDFKFSLIPTSLVFLASLVALFFNYFALPTPLFIDRILAAFGVAIFFWLIVVITRKRGMGEGDIVLGFMMGMILGIKGGTLAVFLGFLVGAVVSLALIFFGKKHFGQTVPFAPFLVLGLLVSMFWGQRIVDVYLMLY